MVLKSSWKLIPLHHIFCNQTKFIWIQHIYKIYQWMHKQFVVTFIYSLPAGCYNSLYICYNCCLHSIRFCLYFFIRFSVYVLIFIYHIKKRQIVLLHGTRFDSENLLETDRMSQWVRNAWLTFGRLFVQSVRNRNWHGQATIKFTSKLFNSYNDEQIYRSVWTNDCVLKR